MFNILLFTKQGRADADEDVFRFTGIEGGMVGTTFMAIHPMVVETFHPEPQMSTSWWCERKCRDHQT